MSILDRIMPVLRKNFFSESRDRVWNECMGRAICVELNEVNLENMCGTDLVCGFGGGSGMKEVIALAGAVGVSGITNPENNAMAGHYVSPPVNVDNLSLDDMLERIQPKLPFQIEFPPFTGNCLQGLPTEKYGTVTDRYVMYLWVLKRIVELCPDRNSGIIEIGAGFGALGYYLDKAGYHDYTTIDLALVNACQTYFLAKNMPDRTIILSGDVENPFDLQYRDSIKLLHSTDFHDIPSNRFAIMVNMDGMTEYGIEAATGYVQSDCAPMLLSINHEVNPYRVIDIPQHRKLQYRYPFWLREGYVEELYVEAGA